MADKKRGQWLQERSEDEHREMSRKGGLNARNNPNVHRFKVGSDLAREAGRKGGKASRRRSTKQLEQELAQMDSVFGKLDAIQASYRKHFG